MWPTVGQPPASVLVLSIAVTILNFFADYQITKLGIFSSYFFIYAIYVCIRLLFMFCFINSKSKVDLFITQFSETLTQDLRNSEIHVDQNGTTSFSTSETFANLKEEKLFVSYNYINPLIIL